MVSNRPVADLKGVVINAYPPTKNENGKWRPANFVIETESGEVKVKQFPGGHWDKEKGMKVVPEPISMPGWYNKLVAVYGESLYALVGATIQVTGEGMINPHSMEVEYTVVGENFVVLDDETLEPDDEVAALGGKIHQAMDEVAALGKSNPAPVQIPPRPTTPPPEQPRTYSLDERIAWNSAVNNANLALLSRLTGTVLTSDSAKSYTKLVSALALQFYEVIRRGPVEIEEEAVEPEPQDPDLELESF